MMVEDFVNPGALMHSSVQCSHTCIITMPFYCSFDVQFSSGYDSNKSYSDRLKNWSLPTLKYRHYRGDDM